MKLSMRSRYGLQLMLELGLAFGRKKLLLKEIAKRRGISEKYLAQIVIPLSKRGLVNSSRGNPRGYTLTRQPPRITVREIIEVLEEDLYPVECLDRKEECSSAGICATRMIWKKLHAAIRDSLESFTLEDVIQEHQRCGKKINFTYEI